ncbi:hypothetical protein WJX75_007609 [Coccomyxa subellipsoidea]|uniref:Uncharacterized protein n=1 Tax=Coccomyxa subellipsoidea TaxID=248742 RepID=A0ABR2YWQ2_9CHLO
MRNEPLPLDIFGDVTIHNNTVLNGFASESGNGWKASGGMSAASTFSTDGGAALYKKGDLAWYRQRDGTFVPAKVVSVDVTVDPPSYAVDLGGNIRETEGPRLRPRGPGDTAPPAAHTPAPALPPVQKPAANFGVPGEVSIHACSGSATVLGDDLGEDFGEDFGDFCDAEPDAPAAKPAAGQEGPLSNGASSPLQLNHNSTASSGALPPPPAHFSGAGKSLEGGGGRGVTPASTIDIARDELDFGDGSDEDGFGDFEDAQSGGAPTDAPSAAVAALDRSAPLPMSLFGEDEDLAEATSSLDLAAPWGSFCFGPPEQATPARQPSTLRQLQEESAVT